MFAARRFGVMRMIIRIDHAVWQGPPSILLLR